MKKNIYKSQKVSKKSDLIGIPTNILEFDNLTGGLQRGDFIVIAARPCMGKTALALNIAANVALHAKKSKNKQYVVCIFSLEMSEIQLVNRLICSEANRDIQRLCVGSISDIEWDKVNILASSNIYIDDTGGLSNLEICSRTRRLKAEKGLDLVIIDYLQLVRDVSSSRNYENSQAEVSRISRSLRALARELDISIIALSQLSSDVETRTNKRPLLSDLRKLGSLEQDADIIAFLYREDYYNSDTETPNIAEFIIAKNRNNATGTVNLFFEKQFIRFRNLEKSDNVMKKEFTL